MVELISRDEHEKLYLQLYEILKKKIESQEWKAGTQIPTEEQLCNMFKISRATVRNAILELVRQGYLIRQQGRGTFVNKNYIESGMIFTTVLKPIFVKDETSYKKSVVTKTVMMPLDILSNELKIPENRHIIYIKILWFNEKNLSLIQESFIPINICPQLLEEDLGVQSIVDILEKKCSIKITKIHNYFEISLLNKDLASSFNLPENHPVLLMTQKVFSGDTVVFLNKIYKRDDIDKLFIAFQRKV